MIDLDVMYTLLEFMASDPRGETELDRKERHPDDVVKTDLRDSRHHQAEILESAGYAKIKSDGYIKITYAGYKVLAERNAERAKDWVGTPHHDTPDQKVEETLDFLKTH